MSQNKTISSDRARACLTFDERPETPPEVRKFRRSKNLEPGKRFIHPGIAEDMEKLKLDDKIFGNKGDIIRIGASELVNGTPLNTVERLNLRKAELTYFTLKREPLGETYKRNYNIPEKFSAGNQPFGRSSASTEPAKNIIFPHMSESSMSTEGEELYKRSHGSYSVGEQKRRGYDWKINPDEVRFGMKGNTIAYNGISKNVSEVLGSDADPESILGTLQVEQMRSMGDKLGKTRDLGQGSSVRTEQFVYGLPSAYSRTARSQWGAAETIRGRYSSEAQCPDPDLGKSVTPGFRNNTTNDRVYGCPIVRSDIPLPTRRSVADPQNYGDETSARDLIHPHTLAGTNVELSELEEFKPRATIRTLFAKIGYPLDDSSFEAVWRDAAGDGEQVSIAAFRESLNMFLEYYEQ